MHDLLSDEITRREMTKIFISYVHENKPVVERLVASLVPYELDILIDFNIPAGTRWSKYIKNNIREGDYFIGCFSKEYEGKLVTYMNEELTVAIEQLRQRSTNGNWFIPVKLNECNIPNREIGAGESFRSLQWVELYQNWDIGIDNILEAIGIKKNQQVLEVMYANEYIKSLPPHLTNYAKQLVSLKVSPSILKRCMQYEGFFRDKYWGLKDLDDITITKVTNDVLDRVPKDYFLEEWKAEEIHTEIVSFINSRGELFHDTVRQKTYNHPYDAALSITSYDGQGIREVFSVLKEMSTNIQGSLKETLERMFDIKLIIVFVRDFDGFVEIPQDKKRLEIYKI